MTSPYQRLPRRSFWKTGVASRDLASVFQPRFAITKAQPIATAGSCFAQHVARYLRRAGCQVIDTEPAPYGLRDETARRFGYGLYSARYGNIYTARQLLQLLQECFGQLRRDGVVWERDGRFFDALRPAVEPSGLDSAEEVLAHRADHIRRARQTFESAAMLVFTLGLTEGWVRKSDGLTYPTAPGTIAGDFDPDLHGFVNFGFPEVLADLTEACRLLKTHNPGCKLLLTVSPVPLAATASPHHVLVANSYSKAVLRAAAGALCEACEDVDYFPSYEIIATPFLGERFYAEDLRTVTEAGVAMVMRLFMEAYGLALDSGEAPAAANDADGAEEDALCDEALLEAFAP